MSEQGTEFALMNHLDNQGASSAAEIRSGNFLSLDQIYSKGFGVIPKFVMEDSSLPLKSKALYAYICALAGRGNSAFPLRETICGHLCFSESTYKKHCSILTNAGYIRIHQRTKLNKNNHFCYGSNTYELVSSPPSYIRYCEGKVDEYGQSFVSGEGIEGAGYGTIPYYVMCMKNLSADAKAVYAYLCSLCGAGELAYLSYAGISNILNISRNSTDKYMKALISSGLITITQMRKPDGTYGLGRCVIKKKIAAASERVSSMETYQNPAEPQKLYRAENAYEPSPSRGINGSYITEPQNLTHAENSGVSCVNSKNDCGECEKSAVLTGPQKTAHSKNRPLKIHTTYHKPSYTINQDNASINLSDKDLTLPSHKDRWIEGATESLYLRNGNSVAMLPLWKRVIEAYKMPSYTIDELLSDVVDEYKARALQACWSAAAATMRAANVGQDQILGMAKCGAPSLPTVLMTWANAANEAMSANRNNDFDAALYLLTGNSDYPIESLPESVVEVIRVFADIMETDIFGSFRINGHSIPASKVRAEVSKLKLDDIEEVADRYLSQEGEVKKFREYITAMLFNQSFGRLLNVQKKVKSHVCGSKNSGCTAKKNNFVDYPQRQYSDSELAQIGIKLIDDNDS